MSVQWRQITGDDYIPDMIETINDNTQALVEAINDLNDIINDGDAELSSVKINVNGEPTDEGVFQSVGKMSNNGDFTLDGKLTTEEVEVNGTSTFNGATTFTEEVTFDDDINFGGEQTIIDSPATFLKRIKLPIRRIEQDELTGNQQSGAWQIEVDNDFYILFDESNVTISPNQTFRFISASNNQVIKFTAFNLTQSTQVSLRLTAADDIQLNEGDSVTLAWMVDSQESKWIVIDGNRKY